MRVGKIIKRSSYEDHLDNAKWVQVYPDGTLEDMRLIQSIPPEDRTYQQSEPKHPKDQSPILVRRTVWKALSQNIVPKVFVSEADRKPCRQIPIVDQMDQEAGE